MILHILTLFDVCSKWGLTVSMMVKLVVTMILNNSIHFKFGKINLEIVNKFNYLGSVIHCNAYINCDVEHRIVAGRSLGN